MPRVHQVKKCRKHIGPCGRCGKEIEVGDSYVWWKFRYGGQRNRCADPACWPKASELTQSEFLSTLYGIQERLAEAEGPDDVAELIDEIRDLGNEQEDKLSNMPEGLQEGDTGQLLQGRADACSEWADELEAVEMPVTEEDDETEEMSPDEALDSYLADVTQIDYNGD